MRRKIYQFFKDKIIYKFYKVIKLKVIERMVDEKSRTTNIARTPTGGLEARKSMRESFFINED